MTESEDQMTPLQEKLQEAGNWIQTYAADPDGVRLSLDGPPLFEGYSTAEGADSMVAAVANRIGVEASDVHETLRLNNYALLLCLKGGAPIDGFVNGCVLTCLIAGHELAKAQADAA
jgi:hypothetical protein